MVIKKGTNRRAHYSRRLAQLMDELAAVESDIETAPDALTQGRLEKKAEKLLDKIDDVEVNLAKFDADSPQANVRDRSQEKTLQKLDFVQAKKTAGLIRDQLSQDGGAVLFFLQKTRKQMGRFCIEEVLNVILGDQIIDGKVVGAYRRYSVDLDSAISQLNEAEFLIRLASYFKIEESEDLETLSQQLREKIRTSIDEGTTIFLEIRSLDELIEQADFLRWFIQDFWQPLIDDVAAVSQKYKSKFIVALIADSQMRLNCSTEYFCEPGDLDCYKFLELPLPDWSVDDIYDWLITFRTVYPKLRGKNGQDLKRIAAKIHRASEGTPQNVCANLQEQFL
ncbi:hypothetical protein PN498_09800 [Oscillatoria sp. CS-180]|uniref:hypothetical protein n=1 Tax=Oscillatoria sp. CS-180 TaxID=3021720 RepID=UPI00232CEBDA|nr:hypothetical protein [Oscillatoria sp. CS-180]MDB9526278.1 hypothetical protein [Oscillatoria sp. CS-180]